MDVQFNRDNMTIEIQSEGHDPYEIDLSTCTTSAELLDWIYQLHGKSWMDDKTLRKVVEAFEKATRDMLGKTVQAAFCPFGRPRTVEWKRKEVTSHVQ